MSSFTAHFAIRGSLVVCRQRKLDKWAISISETAQERIHSSHIGSGIQAFVPKVVTLKWMT